MVQGSNAVVRVNGTAETRVDDDIVGLFDVRGRRPRSVIVIHVAEVYSQCARALMRAQTWSGVDHSDGLPTVGEMLAQAEAGFDAVS